MVFAVDFDGTLYFGGNSFPQIGEPNIKLIEFLKSRREFGDKLILWTARHGKFLDDAVEWCASFGLYFDAINDDVPEIIEFWGDDRSKKVTADYYIDDRSLKPYEVFDVK
ncbi:MAG: hypothetical protein KBS82_05365 [Oscillospiraceae bacterium]|nr:hypothetical protein [Candidatus Limimonas egerieequi]